MFSYNSFLVESFAILEGFVRKFSLLGVQGGWGTILNVLEEYPAMLVINQERTIKSQQQQIFPQVRGRCGPRFTLPSGAPTKCEAG